MQKKQENIKELKQEDFKQQLKLPAIKVKNTQIQSLVNVIKILTYDRVNAPRIVSISNQSNWKLVLLKENVTKQSVENILNDNNTYIQTKNQKNKQLKVEQNGKVQQKHNQTVSGRKKNRQTQRVKFRLVPQNQQILLEENSIIFTFTTISLNFENFTTSQIFNYYYPQIPPPNSFQTIAHIAHYNLTQLQRPYGNLIGEILLHKNKLIKTVVNKTQKLHNVYRTPVLQLLAGSFDYQVELRQQGVRFSFNFQKVYWCSRLQTQRDRLLKFMKSGQTLIDLFCGVGPLAVRAAKKGLFVIANDLNPDCYKYLIQNSKLNDVQNRMLCFNDCARRVLQKWYDPQFTNSIAPYFRAFHHVYMNLPVDAIEFLEIFQGFQRKTNHLVFNKLPIIHVNGFVVGNSHQQCLIKLQQRIRRCLPYFRKQSLINYELIKNVTIIMRMYCLSFELSKQDANLSEQQCQKLKHGNSNVKNTENGDQEQNQFLILDEVKKKVKLN